ncbi:unnamed protein product [Amoebophrya sp. A120]|nr:unnamed protein product [Amoebophrya sp. A120]|eukprot:GSA120T00017035001.1
MISTPDLYDCAKWASDCQLRACTFSARAFGSTCEQDVPWNEEKRNQGGISLENAGLLGLPSLDCCNYASLVVGV